MMDIAGFVLILHCDLGSDKSGRIVISFVMSYLSQLHFANLAVLAISLLVQHARFL
jgi:hypothetical protein